MSEGISVTLSIEKSMDEFLNSDVINEIKKTLKKECNKKI